METTKGLRKSAAGGSVRTRSSGTGSTGGSATDRAHSETRKHGNGILESAANAELRLALDGEVTRGLFGYDSSTESRVLFVPHTKAADAAYAILLCRQGGILREKLARMDNAAAAIAYATTLARSELEN